MPGGFVQLDAAGMSGCDSASGPSVGQTAIDRSSVCVLQLTPPDALFEFGFTPTSYFK